MKTTEEIRAEFEKKHQGYSFFIDDDDVYENDFTRIAWEHYLAGFNARQAENKEALEALEEIVKWCDVDIRFPEQYVIIKKALSNK